jgi:tRNA uridine 5-carbamoylmethylation protein Kti12
MHLPMESDCGEMYFSSRQLNYYSAFTHKLKVGANAAHTNFAVVKVTRELGWLLTTFY